MGLPRHGRREATDRGQRNHVDSSAGQHWLTRQKHLGTTQDGDLDNTLSDPVLSFSAVLRERTGSNSRPTGGPNGAEPRRQGRWNASLGEALTIQGSRQRPWRLRWPKLRRGRHNSLSARRTPKANILNTAASTVFILMKMRLLSAHIAV